MQTILDLSEAAHILAQRFPAFEAIHIFGSRVHGTSTASSDVDLLAISKEPVGHIEAESFCHETMPWVDLFISQGGDAESVSHHYVLSANSLSELLSGLGARLVWSRSYGFCLPDQTVGRVVEMSSDLATSRLDRLTGPRFRKTGGGGPPRVRPRLKHYGFLTPASQGSRKP